jgi:hypothetical protein
MLGKNDGTSGLEVGENFTDRSGRNIGIHGNVLHIHASGETNDYPMNN